MREPIRGRAFRVAFLGCLMGVGFASGCAPSTFGKAIAYYSEKTAVTDAAARHTTASPYYRFNSALLDDLDRAIEHPNGDAQRKMAKKVLRVANRLAQASSANEIERMPASARERLAAIAGTSADAGVLQQRFSGTARATLEDDLRNVNRLLPSALKKKLRVIRNGVEALPDDQGRRERQILYAWAALLTADGIAREEAKLTEKSVAKAEKKFDRIAMWRPRVNAGDSLIERYAPVIGVEWPEKRHYDVDYDRIGSVKLSKDRGHIEVHIDPMEPAVYAYTTAAEIQGRRLRQLNYVWWFPERPEMSPDDPAAGHVDGSMLRITLGADDRPTFIESSLNCGCGHEVFVSQAVESAAREAFGSPLPGKRFAVEKRMDGKHDVIVIHAFNAGADSAHPLVLSAAGYHEVCQVRFNETEWSDGMDIAEGRSYDILDYDELDRLPLGGGIASMFGPDGLVHFAGRPEGVLLAPSGMLSAGQPRKRGTQRIRWDDFLHDDPHLLETTLRIPARE